MQLRPRILQYPHTLLRTRCEPVTDFAGIRELAAQMIAAATAPWQAGCVGLAANQIAVLKRVVIVRQGGQWLTLVNPRVVESSGEQVVRDGCMSFDFGRAFKPRSRPAFIRVEYQDEDGNECRRKAKGINAAVIAHEIDHLDGKMFFDTIEEAA